MNERESVSGDLEHGSGDRRDRARALLADARTLERLSGVADLIGDPELDSAGCTAPIPAGT